MEEDLELRFEHTEKEDSKGWLGRIRNIIRNSKPLNELIVEEKFLVEYVDVETSIARIVIDNNRYDEWGNTLGPDGRPFDDIYNDLHNINESDGGMIFNCELKVRPYNKDCPITTLTFFGPTPAMAGHVITAKIARYTAHIFRHDHRRFYHRSRDKEKERINTSQPYFTDRPYASVEQALNIAICDGDKVLRNDKSPIYRAYLKE